MTRRKVFDVKWKPKQDAPTLKRGFNENKNVIYNDNKLTTLSNF